jgi:hypothetical protein
MTEFSIETLILLVAALSALFAVLGVAAAIGDRFIRAWRSRNGG